MRPKNRAKINDVHLVLFRELLDLAQKAAEEMHTQFVIVICFLMNRDSLTRCT